MSLYLTKADLYNRVERFRSISGINSLPIDFMPFIKQFRGIKIEAAPFENLALRGILSFGHGDKDDIILLNSNRTAVE